MTILVVDGMPAVYQMYSTVGHLQTRVTKIPTGLRYGFIRLMRAYTEAAQARKSIICWDSPGPIFKAAGSPDYKSNRVMTPEKQKMYDQIPDLKAMLALTRYSQIESPGYEADDLCATVARFYEKSGETVVIATVDRDLYSVVSPLVTIKMTGKEKLRVDELVVEKEFGVLPRLVPLVKAVRGDKSDAVASLMPPIVQAGFEKYLLSNQDKEPKEIVDGFFVSSDLGERLKAQIELMRLHDVPKDKWVVTKGKADAVGLERLFKELEFASMVKFLPEFVESQFE